MFGLLGRIVIVVVNAISSACANNVDIHETKEDKVVHSREYQSLKDMLEKEEWNKQEAKR